MPDAFLTTLHQAWWDHLESLTDYTDLNLTPFKWHLGMFLPKEPTSDRISVDVLPAHAVRGEDGLIEGVGGIEGRRRDVLTIVGALIYKANEGHYESAPIERAMDVLINACERRIERQALEARTAGDVEFTMFGGPQPQRDGSAGRPRTWAWLYKLRLTGPGRQFN